MKLIRINALFAGLLTVIFISGIAMRCYRLTVKAFEYDEIWTLTNYVNKANSVIFSDLRTPNNHPVNSLLIKYLVPIFGPSQLTLRIIPLLCGIALLATVACLTWNLFKNRIAVVAAVLLCSFNGGLIHYSQTGRGYMLQTFMLTLMLLAIVLYEKYRNINSIFKAFSPVIILLSAITAILTLSPSILFITAFAALHIFYLFNIYIVKADSTEYKNKIIRGIKENMPLILCYVMLYAFAVYWYISNLEQFRAGQQFGIQINSITVLWNYIKSFFPKLSGYILPFIPLLMLLSRNYRKWVIAYLFVCGTIFLSFFIFRGGPPRSYLPLIPVIAVAIAGTAGITCSLFSKNHLRNSTVAAFLYLIMVICSLYHYSTLKIWQPTDWRRVWLAAQKAFPEKNSFISYPACAGLEVSFNNRPAASLDNYQRMIQTGRFIQIGTSGTISTTDRNGLETEIKVSGLKPLVKEIGGVKAEVYKIKKLTSANEDTGPVIAYIQSNKPELIKAARRFLMYESGKDWHIVNIWLTINKKPFKYFMISSGSLRLTARELLSIENRSGRTIRFFYLTN